ncbi:DUF2269 domain-containing protein [Nocardioides sp. SOB77]|uniref:DUF2269 domain-containing protein n=1 Tax=Nocardioides oceani TaxID=3058369 RepID=A0ABT8FMM2_9ACTN|nr:DUF2269 domain-containing protein [Nocardioides oceani]MDN4175794.1 DUF2269 domain-containing protein [Nocardioides oceani]
MRIAPRARKAGLTIHVCTSVGWFGAVIVYFALGAAAAFGGSEVLTAAAYLVMDWAAWTVLVPLALASLATGIAQAVTTPWGLMQHYWVTIKLIITLIATVVLIAYTPTLNGLAEVAARVPLAQGDLQALRSPTVLVDTTGALLLLLAATVLAIYKPAGLTRHGQRTRLNRETRNHTTRLGID